MALDGMKIVKIAAGGWHSAAISEFNDLYMFGWNESGQLAQATNLQKPAECFSAVEKLLMACCTMQVSGVNVTRNHRLSWRWTILSTWWLSNLSPWFSLILLCCVAQCCCVEVPPPTCRPRTLPSPEVTRKTPSATGSTARSPPCLRCQTLRRRRSTATTLPAATPRTRSWSWCNLCQL